MTAATVRPGSVSGVVRAPPSKSYTHRAIVVGHLAGRRFQVRNPLDSDDTRATARAVSVLGSPVVRRAELWSVRPSERGHGRSENRILCGASGTTLRFASALAARSGLETVLDGENRLGQRPNQELLDALARLGATCQHPPHRGLPLRIRGPIHGGSVTLNASESSQFASALLLALPTLAEDSTLRLRGEVVSRPYLDATVSVLRHHVIRVRGRDRRFEIPGRQVYRGSGFRVPGDASSAAYLWAAAAIGGGEVRVTGLDRAWPQADLAVLDLLASAGAHVTREPFGARVQYGKPTPFRADLTECPDLYPLAGVLAATTPGASRITGAQHVAFKESDRRAATARLARRLGAKVNESSAGLRIEGRRPVRAVRLPRLRDHRMVMSAAVAALAADGPSVVGERSAVRKSFPGFWSTLDRVTSHEVGA